MEALSTLVNNIIMKKHDNSRDDNNSQPLDKFKHNYIS